MKKLISFLLIFTLLLIPTTTAFAEYAYSELPGSDILRNGSKGTQVKKLQNALIDLGYLTGKADGVYGSKTEAAVKEFQRKNGFAGEVGYAGVATMFTQAALYNCDALQAKSPYMYKNTVSGNYAVRSPSLRYTTTLDCSFTFVNGENERVNAICIYYWLADSKGNFVTMNGYNYWMQWYTGLDLKKDDTLVCKVSLDATSKELAKASEVQFIVGEIAYRNDNFYITFDASQNGPYYPRHYTMGKW